METYDKDYYWEFYLRDNPLTKDNTEDRVAEVKTGPRTLNGEDIAKEIKRTGSELKYETILSVVAQSNGIILESLLNGDSVMTDLCQFTPRIIGAFENETAGFDPEVNRLTFDIVLTKNVREALRRVRTINLGAKAETARIGLVTDTLTGLTSGKITAGEDIQIDGSRIKIAGDDEANGIFFISEDGKTSVKVTRRLTQNAPSRVIARVPALTAGKYTLRVVTQYSSSSTLLKSPRVMEYGRLLQVGGDSDSPDEV